MKINLRKQRSFYHLPEAVHFFELNLFLTQLAETGERKDWLQLASPPFKKIWAYNRHIQASLPSRRPQRRLTVTHKSACRLNLLPSRSWSFCSVRPLHRSRSSGSRMTSSFGEGDAHPGRQLSLLTLAWKNSGTYVSLDKWYLYNQLK